MFFEESKEGSACMHSTSLFGSEVLTLVLGKAFENFFFSQSTI